jgi:transposase
VSLFLSRRSAWLWDLRCLLSHLRELGILVTLHVRERRQTIFGLLRLGYLCSAAQIAEMVGVKIQTIRNLHAAYLKEGESVLQLTGKGGRYRSNLSSEEEDALLAAFEVNGTLGKIVEVSQIHRAYEQHVGRPVPNSTVYR